VMEGAGRADLDESLLTGESDLIAKTAGDDIHSGSFCVNGSVTVRHGRLEHVDEDCLVFEANREVARYLRNT